MKRKKYESTIKIYGDVEMNGKGITKIIKGRWEEITLEEFIEDLQASAMDQGIEQVYDFSFYFNYDGLSIDYDADIVSDKNIDEMNDFLFYSTIKVGL